MREYAFFNTSVQGEVFRKREWYTDTTDRTASKEQLASTRIRTYVPVQHNQSMDGCTYKYAHTRGAGGPRQRAAPEIGDDSLSLYARVGPEMCMIGTRTPKTHTHPMPLHPHTLLPLHSPLIPPPHPHIVHPPTPHSPLPSPTTTIPLSSLLFNINTTAVPQMLSCKDYPGLGNRSVFYPSIIIYTRYTVAQYHTFAVDVVVRTQVRISLRAFLV